MNLQGRLVAKSDTGKSFLLQISNEQCVVLMVEDWFIHTISQPMSIKGVTEWGTWQGLADNEVQVIQSKLK